MSPEVWVAIITSGFGFLSILLTALLARANQKQKKTITKVMVGANEGKAAMIGGLAVFNLYKDFKKPESDGGVSLTPTETVKLITAAQNLGMLGIESLQKVLDAGEES